MPDRGDRILCLHRAQPRRTSAPFLNLKLLTDRNYAIGLALVTIYGMLNFTPMVLLPPLLQQHVGFTGRAGRAGDRLPRHRHDDRLHDRGLHERGSIRASAWRSALACRPSAGLWMLTFDLNVTMEILVINSAIQGFAVGVVWVPITVVAFDTLEAKHFAEASSIFHLLRNIGSSFFISLSIAEIVRTTGANYSRMTEMITPYNRALTMPGLTGGWDFDTVPGLARVAKEIMPPVGDDRLSQRLHDVHGDVGAGGRVRADGRAGAARQARDAISAPRWCPPPPGQNAARPRRTDPASPAGRDRARPRRRAGFARSCCC